MEDNKLYAELDRLKTANKELLEACKELIEEIDNGLVSGTCDRRQIIFNHIRVAIAGCEK